MLSYIIIGIFALVFILNFVKGFLNAREVKTMTLKKFRSCVQDYVSRKDGKGLISFIGRNFVFVVTHKKDVEDILRAYSSTSENNSNSEV